jgi:hypothetical protein
MHPTAEGSQRNVIWQILITHKTKPVEGRVLSHERTNVPILHPRRHQARVSAPRIGKFDGRNTKQGQ